MNNLKPCPFCGGQIKEVRLDHANAPCCTFTYFCECGMKFEKTTYCRPGDAESGMNYSFRLWNTRMRQTLEDGEPAYSLAINGKTMSNFEKLSGDYNRGYTKAIQDVIQAFEIINYDLTNNNLRMNYSWAKKTLECCLKNREKLRENRSGLIRIEKSESGKRDVVNWVDYKEN